MIFIFFANLITSGVNKNARAAATSPGKRAKENKLGINQKLPTRKIIFNVVIKTKSETGNEVTISIFLRKLSLTASEIEALIMQSRSENTPGTTSPRDEIN